MKPKVVEFNKLFEISMFLIFYINAILWLYIKISTNSYLLLKKFKNIFKYNTTLFILLLLNLQI